MSVVLANARRYRRGRKKLKSQLLNELAPVLHYNRRYLALLLRTSGRSVFTHYRTRLVADPRVSLVSRRGRKKTYTTKIVPYLKAVWQLADGISSVHLAAFIKANPDVVFRHPELKGIPARLKQQLLTISPATIDRRLGPVRDKDVLKQRYTRNPHAPPDAASSSRPGHAGPVRARHEAAPPQAARLLGQPSPGSPFRDGPGPTCPSRMVRILSCQVSGLPRHTRTSHVGRRSQSRPSE
jgi:hypothetical protein